MSTINVEFRYLTGLKRNIFRNARLSGSWDSDGKASASWSEVAMTNGVAEDGCPCFTATVGFDNQEVANRFRWGVRLDGPTGANIWGIPTEVQDVRSSERYREFVLQPAGSEQTEDFYFTYARRMGARKFFAKGAKKPDLKFSVWAPNAQSVDVVFGLPKVGYIDDVGGGIDPAMATISMVPGQDGIWQSAVIPDFANFEGKPYMYRLKTAQDSIVYRTDIFSRDQIGRGGFDPGGKPFAGPPDTLDGSKSCSLVVSLDTVSKHHADPLGERISEADFWASEFKHGISVPSRVEDLVIFELHVNALGFNKPGPGTLSDAMDLLPYLSDLGVNAVELLPMSEFSGGPGWGYGDSHYFVIESSTGGRDDYKHFVRRCHQLGIAVLQDVCYNHYDFNASRDEWQYDSDSPEQNIFYWYEGKPSDYSFREGGYIDNGSTGFAPRYWEEIVRHLFVSSAAAFIEEFHVDGLRVDLTQAIHKDNRLHANGDSVASANQFGIKMLREWSRTLHLIKPSAMLIAEDHTGWEAVTQLPDAGGLGFNARWLAAFYHNLVGDSDMAGGKARLIKVAGVGGDEPLDFEQFASVLYESQFNSVVYHESHDEAGNAGGTQRTIACAVNGAALLGSTRDYAEARSRVAFGLSLFSAGTPMFFMGEEIGAQKLYKFDSFMNNRENLVGERAGDGARLFRFYQDAIRFSKRNPAARSAEIDIIHVIGANRLIAFTRSAGSNRLLIVANLRNEPFNDGYVIQTDPSRLRDGAWQEVFSSDAGLYGGKDIGNFGAAVSVSNGRIQIRVPANGFLIFRKL